MHPAGVLGQGGTPGFRWHEAARLVGPDGGMQGRHAAFASVLPDRPGGVALAAALSACGAAFRIGGEGGLVAQAGYFETLTGGSLGGARRVVRSQGSWCASFAVNARLFGIGPSVRIAVPGRLSHSLALYAALEGLCLGAEVHLLDGLRPDRMARAIVERRIEVIYATPVHLAQMVALAPFWSALRLVLVGGAKLEPGLRSALAVAAPSARVHEFYGAAETSFITLTGQDPFVRDGPETVGHPYPGVELRILGAGENEVAAGETGMVWVRSPYLFEDYAGADRGSARWRDGWLSVGEIGAMTAGGLVLRGRSGRMVTIAGQNIFPEELERFMGTLPGVERVAVLALPDGLRGHVLCAVAMGDQSQEEAILREARARLGTLLAPRRMFWRQDWPMLASGKTDLAVLQAEVPAWR